jgi:acetylornithine/succinyldiaminopimelate/putrescine aminotransferase
MDHFTPLGSWSSEKLNKSRQENPFMMTWVPSKARHAVPNMTHGKGVYLYDDHGKEYLDWTSQAVCSNLGHDVPEAVVQAGTFFSVPAVVHFIYTTFSGAFVHPDGSLTRFLLSR